MRLHFHPLLMFPQRVSLDIPKSVPVMQKPYVYQWIYTAMTRARKELYIVDGFWLI